MTDTKQPIWRYVGNLGDVHPLDYGGKFVFEDSTGVYAPEVEILIEPMDDGNTDEYIIHRFNVEPCTYVDGVLSDNKYHPEHAVWFADELGVIAEGLGISRDEYIGQFLSEDVLVRAAAWIEVGEYYGWNNLDDYPLTLTRAEAKARIVKNTTGVRV